MTQNDWETAYYSLLSCMVGLISTADLLHIKLVLGENASDVLNDYYARSIDEHCKMTIYANEWLM